MQQEVLGDDLLRCHVGDPDSGRNVCGRPAAQQSGRQPQRVRGGHVVVGQPVDQQQRPGQRRPRAATRSPRAYAVGVLARAAPGTARCTRCRTAATASPGHRRSRRGRLGAAAARTARRGTRRTTSRGWRPEPGRAPRDGRPRPPAARRPGPRGRGRQVEPHGALQRRRPRRAAAVGDDDGESLVRPPLGLQVAARRCVHEAVVRAAVRVHQHRQRRVARRPPGGQQQGGRQPVRAAAENVGGAAAAPGPRACEVTATVGPSAAPPVRRQRYVGPRRHQQGGPAVDDRGVRPRPVGDLDPSVGRRPRVHAVLAQPAGGVHEDAVAVDLDPPHLQAGRRDRFAVDAQRVAVLDDVDRRQSPRDPSACRGRGPPTPGPPARARPRWHRSSRRRPAPARGPAGGDSTCTSGSPSPFHETAATYSKAARSHRTSPGRRPDRPATA